MGLSDLPAEAPRRIKPHEWERYNPGWVEVSLPGHGFVPQPDHQRYKVTYLWVLKPPRRLIVGIEASNVDALRGFLALYGIRGLSHDSLTAMLGLGHPSLSAQFEAAGLPRRPDLCPGLLRRGTGVRRRRLDRQQPLRAAQQRQMRRDGAAARCGGLEALSDRGRRAVVGLSGYRGQARGGEVSRLPLCGFPDDGSHRSAFSTSPSPLRRTAPGRPMASSRWTA